MRGESNLLPERPLWVRAVKRLGLTALLRGVAGALSIGTLSSEYFAHYGVPTDRIFLAPYTVDNAFFRGRLAEAREEAKKWRAELGIGLDQRVVLFAAKLIPVKAPADLLEAFVRLKRKDATLVFVGDGALRDDLAAMARRLPDANTKFVGFVNQQKMPAAYALGDVFVLPSRFEPWGLAVNEAMNLGLPVIVSDQVGAAPDLVSPANGWRFRAGDGGALTRVLGEALDDPDGLARRGQASLDRIAKWDIPDTAEGFVLGARAVRR
jgi:glycosyltransferase involved in cell wall biosynthesis